MFLQNLALFSCASLAATSGSVLLVDAVSGPFFDIQSAVDASVDGDVVLVRTGNYSTFAVIARDLAVVADTGANVQVQGAVRVRDVGVGQALVVAGLRAQGTAPSGLEGSGFRATGCAGSIRIQDCEFTAAPGPACNGTLPEPGPPGVRIRACNDVAIARSLLVGGAIPGGYYSSQPTGASGPGIEVETSRVALQQVDARGPNGGHGCPDGSSGGSGALVRRGSEIDVQACTFLGGSGGSGSGSWFAFGGNGGSGLALLSACPDSSVARVLASTFQGGAAGHGICSIFCGGQTYDGYPGTGSWAAACASIVPLAGVAPSLDCAAVVRENTALALAFTGTPGDRLWVRTARATGHAWDPARNGVRLVEGGLGRWLLAAELGAPGQATYALPIPPLPVGEQARVFHLQVQAERPDGSIQLGAARSVVIVDSAF